MQFIQLPTVDDTVNLATGQYNSRQVDRDYYHSYTAVARILQGYRFLKNESHFAMGVKFGNSKTLRKQKGAGTSGSDFDLRLTAPYRIDLAFDTRNYALFAENLFQLTKGLSFTPGFRFEWIQTRMDGVIPNLANLQLPYRLNRSFPLFGAGLEYRIGAAVHAYANITRNFRPVLHSDLIPATDLDRIDPVLKDAKGNTSEFGVRGVWKDLVQFDLNYFRLQYDNRIGTLILSDDKGPYFYHTNIGDMVNQGSECYVEFRPLHLLQSPPRGWEVTLFSSTAYNAARYTRGSVTVAGENRDITGHVVENIPHWISRNGLSLRRRQVSATLQDSYVGANFSDALNTASTPSGINGIVPAYWLMDINVTWRLRERYTIRCSINNMADKRYFTRRATGYPGPGILPSDGRSVVVSVGATL